MKWGIGSATRAGQEDRLLHLGTDTRTLPSKAGASSMRSAVPRGGATRPVG